MCAAGDASAPARDTGPDQGPPHTEAARIIEGWIAACPAAQGQSRAAALDVVAAALRDGIDAGFIQAGLVRLAADGFVVTGKTLAVAIAQNAAGTVHARRHPAARSVADAVATPSADPDDVGAYLAALRTALPASPNGDRKEGP